MNEAEFGYVGSIPSSFQRSSAKDLSQGSQILRNDVAEYLKKLADRVNKCGDNDPAVARKFEGVDPAGDEILADKESVLVDVKEKLGAVEKTLDELDALEDFSSAKDTDLNVRYWDSILTMECTLRFISSHFMRLDDSPIDRLEPGSATPLSCMYLAKLSNVCSEYVNRLNNILLKDTTQLRDMERPFLEPPDDVAFFDEESKRWKDLYKKDEPNVIVIRKLLTSAMRMKRVQLRMDAILTHISQITRSTFCGVRYGTSDAMVNVSVCAEFRSFLMMNVIIKWLNLEEGDVNRTREEITDPYLRDKLKVFDDFRTQALELRNEVMFYDAMASSCISPLMFDIQYLDGHRIKLPKEVCTVGGVKLADCVNCSSPTEFSEYNRAVGLVTSAGGGSADEVRTFICEGTARCLYVFDTIIKALADTDPSKEEDPLKTGQSVKPDLCKLAFAALKLRETIEAGVSAWQVCSRSVYPRITIMDIANHFQKYALGTAETNALTKYGYMYSSEEINTFLEGIKELSSLRNPDEELSLLVSLAINRSIQSLHGAEYSAAKFKLSYLALINSCNVDDECCLFDYMPHECIKHSFSLHKEKKVSFYNDNFEYWCKGDSPLFAAVTAPAPTNCWKFIGKESRREIALLNILDVAKAAINFSSDLSVQAYECYARLQHIRHGSTHGLSGACWSHYEGVSVLASRVNRPERAVWHCEALLDKNSSLREDTNFNHVYRIVKILASQYCVVAEFDKARGLLQRYLDTLGTHPNTRMDVDAQIRLKNAFNDLTVSLARVNLLDGCPDRCAEIIQDFLRIKDIHNELGEGDTIVEISESAMALLARAYLDMDDLVRATRIIMVIKNIRTERKAARALLKKQLLARGGKLRFKAEYQQVKKTRGEGTISTMSSVSADDNQSDATESFEMHVNADVGAFDEFYLSTFSDLMLTHIPSYCVPDLNIDMGALQAVTLMKSKAYESALHSLVPTIIGVEQTVQKSQYPVEGVLELANLYLLRGKIAFEASTRCVNVEFPFKVEAMNTYSIVKQLMTENDNMKFSEAPPASDFGYGHQDSHYAAPSDLLRDAIKWFERSHRMFTKAKAPSCVAKSAHWIALCHLEAMFVPCTILGTAMAKATDISPPLMKSLDNLHVVHKLDVKSDVDIGGLFGTPSGSLSSGSVGGSTISTDRTKRKDGGGNFGSVNPSPNFGGNGDGEQVADGELSNLGYGTPDAHRVSIKNTARILRSAMTSAVNSRNVPLMIDLYLSTAELKFIKGDKAGAISSWGQARNFFFRMLVVGTSIPIARRASLPHLRRIERQLGRLIRFLWVCDKAFINANVLMFDLHLNFTLDRDRAIRQNVLISHRMSFDLDPLLAKLDNQYEVAKLAEFEQTDRIKSTSAAADMPDPKDNNADSSSTVTGDDLSTHETFDHSSADGATSRTLDTGSVGSVPTMQDQSNSSQSGGSSGSGSGETSAVGSDTLLPKIAVPLHISMKGKIDTHVASLRTVKKSARSTYGHARDGVALEKIDPSVVEKDEAMVRRAWSLYLCLARSSSIHQQKGQYSRVKELGMEEIFSAISTCTVQMATNGGMTNIGDVNFDSEQAVLLEETLKKVASVTSGVDISSIGELPMLASDRGMRLCKVVYAVQVADLMLVYHPFSGRKHAQLFGCANFASYADANEFLEPRLRSLVVNSSVHNPSEITYNYPRNQHGGMTGFSLEQISLGSEFSKLVCDHAIANDGAKCSGGPPGRLMIANKLRNGPLSALSRFLVWASDTRLYDHLFQSIAGASMDEHGLLGSEATYGGMGHNGNPDGRGHSHGHLGGLARNNGSQSGAPHGLGGLTGILTRGIYSMMDPSAASQSEGMVVARPPVTLLCSSALQVIPWELLVSHRDVLFRGLNLLSGTRVLNKATTTLGPTNGHRPVYVGCALGLSGVPIKLKNDIQKCEMLSRELGVAYCVHRLFSSYVPKRSQWYEQSRRKPPFDLQNTRVPPEIVGKYVNVVNSYWRQDLPSYTPLLPIGKTNSQQLRSKPLRRVSFADLSSMLSPDANMDPKELVALINKVDDAPLSAEHKVPLHLQESSTHRFQIIFFSYSDLIEMSSAVSYVLNSKTEEMVCVFVPHFCVSNLAKEIVRAVDACYSDCLLNGGGNVPGYIHGGNLGMQPMLQSMRGRGDGNNFGRGKQQQAPYGGHQHQMAPAYGGFVGNSLEPSGLNAPTPEPWGQVNMNGGANGGVNMNFNLPAAPQSWDNGAADYQMPMADPAASRELTSLALHALINTIKTAEKQQGTHIPIFA